MRPKLQDHRCIFNWVGYRGLDLLLFKNFDLNININIQMKTYKFLFFIFLSAISPIFSQDLYGSTSTKIYDATEGAMTRNLYTTTLYYTNQAIPANRASLNKTMVVGLFDSSQTISYAAVLNDITDSRYGSSQDLVLQVQNITINTAKTQFTLYLLFTREGLIDFSTYGTLGYSIIFIGSNFNKQSSPLSAALARTGKLVDVTTTNSFDAAQFDFVGVTNEASPFDYIVDAAHSNCGVSKVGSIERIELMGCSKPIILSFLSGFSILNPLDSVYISSYVYDPNTPWTLTSPLSTEIVTRPQTSISQPQYIYKADPNDEIVGPKIFFSAGDSLEVKKIQLSMVFVGLRIYSSAYPNGISDSFVVAVGGMGYQYDLPLLYQADIQAIDGLLATGSPLDLKRYNGNTNSDMGHMFCGLVELDFDVKGSLLFKLVDAKAGTQRRFNVSAAIMSLYPYANTAAACLFFSTRTTCVSKQVFVQSTIFSSSVTAPVIVIDKFLTNIISTITSGVVAAGYSFQIGRYTNLNTITKLKITKQFIIPAGQTELIFYSQISSADNSLFPLNTFSYVLKLAGISYLEVYIPNVSVQQPQKIIIHLEPGTTKVTSIFQITINPTLYPSAFILKEGLYYFDKVFNSALSCILACPEVTGSTTGVSVGTNPPTCILCQSNLFQHYFNGQCKCIDRYYFDNNRICQPCNDPLCRSCNAPLISGSATICSNCVSNSILSQLTLTCSCEDGYYRKDNACLPCPYGCSKCNSPSSCNECKSSTNAANFITRLDFRYNCACVDGFYQVLTNPICEPCSQICATCSVSPSACDSCDSTKNLYKDGNTCKCVQGFYLLGNQCAPCSPSCKTCQISSIYCTDCPQNRILTGTNNPAFKNCQCNTNQGYVEIDYTCVDSSCRDLDLYCKNCTLDLTGLRIRQCLSCIGNRIIESGKCICQSGFYQDGNDCKSCGSGCQTCTSAGTCTKCAIGSTSNGDGTCKCKKGFTLVNFSTNFYCQPCPLNCEQCSESNTCDKCKTDFQLFNKKCVCKAKTFASAEGLSCFTCINHCDQCMNQKSCISCASGFKYDSDRNECLIDCPIGKYDDGSVQCQNCPEGCTSCYSSEVCSSCAENYYMFAGSCRLNCPDTTFALSHECYPCPEQCHTCISLIQCNTCIEGYVYIAGKCTSDCPQRTYILNGICLACDINCQNCLGQSTFCTKCSGEKILFNNKCVQICPATIVDGQCTTNCPEGMFLSGKNCLYCDSKCRTCKDQAKKCITCASGFSLQGNCVDSCPTGQYASYGFCALCDISCKSCQQNPFNCNQCAEGYIQVDDNKCIHSCSEGYYYDYLSRNCLSCSNGCKKCLSNIICTECYDSTFTVVGGICQKRCPAHTNLVNNICVCRIGYLHQSVCITNCPEGFYPGPDKTCLICSSPCLKCSELPTSCLSCIQGYNLNPTTKTCTRTSICPYGAYTSPFGICNKICKIGYFSKGCCIYRCPTGYQANIYNGCIQMVSPTYCQTPLFQIGNSCAIRCPTGFWPNPLTRTCDRCTIINCQNCLSLSVCVSCNSGFGLNTDQTACIPYKSCKQNQHVYEGKCLSECPYGTKRSGRYCVRICKPSLFFYEGFCYPFCPTHYESDGACHISCPSGIQCRARHYHH